MIDLDTENRRRAAALVIRAHDLSVELSQDRQKGETINDFLYTFISRPQEDGPDIPLNRDLMRYLSRRDLTALLQAQFHCHRFDTHFGVSNILTSSGRLDYGTNTDVGDYFRQVGTATNAIFDSGILANSTDRFVRATMDADQAFLRLLTWSHETVVALTPIG